MVASPFTYRGTLDRDLLTQVWRELGLEIAHKAVLDIGCGRGLLRPYCLEQGASYVGMDITLAAFPSHAHQGNATFVLADAAHLPFAKDTFDAVICVDVFEHIPRQELAVQEFRRVLRPRGEIFLSIPNYGNVAGLVKQWIESRGHAPRNTWAPFIGWSPQELEQPMTSALVRQLFQSAGAGTMQFMAWETELLVGIFPWFWKWRWLQGAHWRLITWRPLQSFYRFVVAHFPDLSLHHFWRICLNE
jgi:SAM-dependent methyltransferase